MPFPQRHTAPRRRAAAPLQGAPGPLVLDLERTEVDGYLHLELTCEVRWHSPRVPACAASAIRELGFIDHCSLSVDDSHPWSRRCATVLLGGRPIRFAGPAREYELNRNHAGIHPPDSGLHRNRRAGLAEAQERRPAGFLESPYTPNIISPLQDSFLEPLIRRGGGGRGRGLEKQSRDRYGGGDGGDQDVRPVFLHSLHAVFIVFSHAALDDIHIWATDCQFTLPQEESSGLGWLLFLFGGFLPALLYASHTRQRVQCAKCGYIFRQPALPKTSLSVLATWIIGVEFLFLAVTILAIVLPELTSWIPDSQLLSGAERVISDNPRAFLVGLLPMLLVTLLTCTIAFWASNHKAHRELRNHFETRPKRYSKRKGPAPTNESTGS
jgi:hypothetical protein